MSNHDSKTLLQRFHPLAWHYPLITGVQLREKYLSLDYLPITGIPKAYASLESNHALSLGIHDIEREHITTGKKYNRENHTIDGITIDFAFANVPQHNKIPSLEEAYKDLYKRMIENANDPEGARSRAKEQFEKVFRWWHSTPKDCGVTACPTKQKKEYDLQCSEMHVFKLFTTRAASYNGTDTACNREMKELMTAAELFRVYRDQVGVCVFSHLPLTMKDGIYTDFSGDRIDNKLCHYNNTHIIIRLLQVSAGRGHTRYMTRAMLLHMLLIQCHVPLSNRDMAYAVYHNEHNNLVTKGMQCAFCNSSSTPQLANPQFIGPLPKPFNPNEDEEMEAVKILETVPEPEFNISEEFAGNYAWKCPCTSVVESIRGFIIHAKHCSIIKPTDDGIRLLELAGNTTRQANRDRDAILDKYRVPYEELLRPPRIMCACGTAFITGDQNRSHRMSPRCREFMKTAEYKAYTRRARLYFEHKQARTASQHSPTHPAAPQTNPVEESKLDTGKPLVVVPDPEIVVTEEFVGRYVWKCPCTVVTETVSGFIMHAKLCSIMKSTNEGMKLVSIAGKTNKQAIQDRDTILEKCRVPYQELFRPPRIMCTCGKEFMTDAKRSHTLTPVCREFQQTTDYKDYTQRVQTYYGQKKARARRAREMKLK